MCVLLQFHFPGLKQINTPQLPEKPHVVQAGLRFFYVVEFDLEHMIIWLLWFIGVSLDWLAHHFLLFLSVNCRTDELSTVVFIFVL